MYVRVRPLKVKALIYGIIKVLYLWKNINKYFLSKKFKEINMCLAAVKGIFEVNVKFVYII